jgi:hypothetical protein
LCPVMANVVLLNFAYDICVKVFSVHILLLTILLIAPDARVLLGALLRPATTPVSPSGRAQVLLAAVKWSLILAACISLGRMVVADDDPQPLRGAWDVASFSRDGTEVPDCANEPERWRTVLIEDDSLSVITERGARQHFAAQYAADSGSLKLEQVQTGVAYQLRAAPFGTRLAIEGAFAGNDVRVVLQQKTDYLLLRDRMHLVYYPPSK